MELKATYHMKLKGCSKGKISGLLQQWNNIEDCTTNANLYNTILKPWMIYWVTKQGRAMAILSPTSLKTPWGDAVRFPIQVTKERWRCPFREVKRDTDCSNHLRLFQWIKNDLLKHPQVTSAEAACKLKPWCWRKQAQFPLCFFFAWMEGAIGHKFRKTHQKQPNTLRGRFGMDKVEGWEEVIQQRKILGKLSLGHGCKRETQKEKHHGMGHGMNQTATIRLASPSLESSLYGFNFWLFLQPTSCSSRRKPEPGTFLQPLLLNYPGIQNSVVTSKLPAGNGPCSHCASKPAVWMDLGFLCDGRACIGVVRKWYIVCWIPW